VAFGDQEPAGPGHVRIANIKNYTALGNLLRDLEVASESRAKQQYTELDDLHVHEPYG